MSVQYLTLVRGRGLFLTAPEVSEYVKDHKLHGLILVYHAVLENDELRYMRDSDEAALKFQEGFLELRNSWNHPDQLDDEMFLANYDPRADRYQFSGVLWKPRFVEQAFGRNGRIIKGYVAAFAKLKDLFPTLKWTL